MRATEQAARGRHESAACKSRLHGQYGIDARMNKDCRVDSTVFE